MESKDAMQVNVANSNNGKRFAAAAVSAALVATLAVGGSIAYLTDSATIENQFTLDTNLAISLEEANFDAETAQGLLPTQEVLKDPKVSNDGTVEAYIAATVRIPVMSGNILSDDNKLQAVQDHDLYSYELGEGWAQYGDAVVKDGFKTYTYLYTGTLAGNAKTAPIFDAVKVANFTEDPGLENVNIDVAAYAIQSHGFDSATSAYEAYLAQTVAALVVE